MTEHQQYPNILVFTSEDTSPRGRAYGDPTVHTPTIDWLAREGTLFTHAYTTAPVCAPSRFTLLTGAYPSTHGSARNQRALTPLSLDVVPYPTVLRETGYYCTNTFKTDYNALLNPWRIWDDCGTGAHWAHRPIDAPFLAVFNDMTTHESSIFAPIDPESFVATPPIVPPFLPDTPEIREDLQRYQVKIEQMDAHFAIRINELRDAGLLEDTIIIYSADHGGVHPRSKRFCYEEGLRVPLIVRVPQRWAHLWPYRPGSRVDQAISQIDLVPTILAFANAPQAETMAGQPIATRLADSPRTFAFSGRDRMDERYDLVRTVTDGRFRLIRNYMPHRPLGQHQAYGWLAQGYRSWEREHLRGTLTGPSERFWQRKTSEELYDNRRDPYSLENLAASADHADIATELGEKLDSHLRRIGDRGFIPEGLDYEDHPSLRPYPLDRILELAKRASRGDERNLADLAANLADKDPTIRYWALTGLLILGPGAETKRDLIATHLDDPVAQLRVVAGEILAGLGEIDMPRQTLLSLAEPHVSWQTRLQAINALTYAPTLWTGDIKVIRDATDDTNTYIRDAARYLVTRAAGTYTPESRIADPERFEQEMAVRQSVFG